MYSLFRWIFVNWIIFTNVKSTRTVTLHKHTLIITLPTSYSLSWCTEINLCHHPKTITLSSKGIFTDCKVHCVMLINTNPQHLLFSLEFMLPIIFEKKEQFVFVRLQISEMSSADYSNSRPTLIPGLNKNCWMPSKRNQLCFPLKHTLKWFMNLCSRLQVSK